MSTVGTGADVLSLDDAEAERVDRFGGKGARLATLRRAGFPVPDARLFAVGAFGEAFAAEPVRAVLARIGEAAPGRDAGCESLRAVLADTGPECGWWPDMLACLDAWGSLAVRSSSVREDGFRAAGAGQHATALAVDTRDSLRDACADVLASQFSRHALLYWGGDAPEGNTMALVVQRMLAPEVSGVIFSRDPIHGRDDVLLVEACRGLGSGVVDGDGVVERAAVRRMSCEVVSRETRGEERLVPDRDLVGLVEVACAIEDSLGFPVDVEWSIEDGRLHVLQARPITGIEVA